MDRPLKIAMAASEMVPYVKTGGLADVMGALPKALAAYNLIFNFPFERSSISSIQGSITCFIGVATGGSQAAIFKLIGLSAATAV